MDSPQNLWGLLLFLLRVPVIVHNLYEFYQHALDVLFQMYL